MSNITRKIYKYLYKTLYGNVALARKLGVYLGDDCRLIGKVDFGSEPYLIEIGHHVSITNSVFATHDGGVWVIRESHPQLDVIAPIKIGNNVFIGTGCIILPGTIIKNNVVIGAGSIVKGTIIADSVYAGVPARFIRSINDYRETALINGIPTKSLRDKKEYLIKHFHKNRIKD